MRTATTAATMENSVCGHMAEKFLKERQAALNSVLVKNGLRVEVRKVYKPGMGDKFGFEVHCIDGHLPIAPIVYYKPEWILMNDRELTGIILDAVKQSEDFLISGIPEISRTGILENVLPRVLNDEHEEGMIREGIPFCQIGNLDLLAMYYMPFGDNGIVNISNQILKDTETSFKELQEAASRNFRDQLVFRTLESAICNLTGEEEIQMESTLGLWVATTKSGKYGAGVLAVGMDLLRDFGKKLDTQKLIILPSSVHEILVMEDTGADTREMAQMVREINFSVVPEGDVLSNSVYTVDLDQGTIVCHK